MPEIGEVARIVHYLRKHVVRRTISKITALDDNKVFKDCTGEQFRASLTGKKVLAANQQGKYFWLTMSSPPHPIMHLGMTGWIRLSNEATAYYRPEKEEEEIWPPRFWKFQIEFEGTEEVKAAFVDSRRFARVRLLDCKAEQIEKIEPLCKNGPDPIHQADKFTREFFAEKCASKRVPIKALLLDQANVSGLGNWVCDELLYHARVHPEQYCDSLSEKQVKAVYDNILHVAGTACEILSDASKFPENWIMPYRWGKGKDGNVLPSGEKLTFITAAGRTSAIVLSRQKKTGHVSANVKVVDGEGAIDVKEETKSSPKGKLAIRREEKIKKSGKKRKGDEVKEEEAAAAAAAEQEEPKPKKARSRKSEPAEKERKSNTSKKRKSMPTPPDGRRRSARLAEVSEE